MENKVIVRAATGYDVEALTNNLRKEDIEEIEALGSTPYEALGEGYVFSTECYALVLEGETIGLFGVSTYQMPEGYASIWFLGSERTKEIPYEWLIVGKEYINKFLKEYGILTNFVYEKNRLHIKWLKRMGANFEAPINGFKQFFILKEM